MASKKILGIKLDTSSIGWAFVEESDSDTSKNSIKGMGVRVNPLTAKELNNFEQGKNTSTNAERTLKRGIRRSLQRYKKRRENLIDVLTQHGFTVDAKIIYTAELSNTHELYRLRSKAVTERIEKTEFVALLLAINKKRGYKSSRKIQHQENETIVDDLEAAQFMYDQNWTPGQFFFEQLKKGTPGNESFYCSDLKIEWQRIWDFQRTFHEKLLTPQIQKKIQYETEKRTFEVFRQTYQLEPPPLYDSKEEQEYQLYKWRSNGLNRKLPADQLIAVLGAINQHIHNSSGYLSAIGDRSKILHTQQQTIGQYLYQKILSNPHERIKGLVFYRQDYLDEFEAIWEQQALHHKELTPALKAQIRDVVIFYQRRLKSQKRLINFCELEQQQKQYSDNGQLKMKTIGARSIPRSSPLYQEFRVWVNLSHLAFKNTRTETVIQFHQLDQSDKQILFNALNNNERLTKRALLKTLFKHQPEWDLNYQQVDGNQTQSTLLHTLLQIIQLERPTFKINRFDFLSSKERIQKVLKELGISAEILDFDPLIQGKDFEKQAAYQLWHLLYSYEGDNSISGNQKLYEQLQAKFGFKPKHCILLSKVKLPEGYGRYSAKAIRKIFPFIKEHRFDVARIYAGYPAEKTDLPVLTSATTPNHLNVLPRGSLKNPIFEKILNQMIHLINGVLKDPNMGKPDEIRFQLVSELKKNANQRAVLNRTILKTKTAYQKYRAILQSEFGIKHPTYNDLIRYQLYLELEGNGFRTLYTHTFIPPKELFSRRFDIEHIIPKASIFDDSLSNKTIILRNVNRLKADRTAYDFIRDEYDPTVLENYERRCEQLFKNGVLSKAKYLKLLQKGDTITQSINDHASNKTQYLTKKAIEIIKQLGCSTQSISSQVTKQLQKDWGLLNKIHQLSLPVYAPLGLTVKTNRKNSSVKERILNWNNKNDHRQQALDALTIAFTHPDMVYYLKHLADRKSDNSAKKETMARLETHWVYRNQRGNRKFKWPLSDFDDQIDQHLAQILVAYKAKNKVATKNKNRMHGGNVQTVITPRGQMHKESIYGTQYYYYTKTVKIGPKFTENFIQRVTKSMYRNALLQRLKDFNNDPKKAFGGANSTSKRPLYTPTGELVPNVVKTVVLTRQFTIRKMVSPELKLEKVLDTGIRRILEKRLEQYDHNSNQAFTNLDKHPIWLNKEKGIAIKRVTIKGVSNAEPIHWKKDHFGQLLTDEYGDYIPSDFVSTRNNHHVAIYEDQNGELQEELVSFYEAIHRINNGQPVVQKQHPLKWKLLFTLKQNEMFVFPGKEFDPKKMDLTNAKHYNTISNHLYRVQKIASKNYHFRHHLETKVEDLSELKGVTWKSIRSPKMLRGCVKVRINHIGRIVQQGEY